MMQQSLAGQLWSKVKRPSDAEVQTFQPLLSNSLGALELHHTHSFNKECLPLYKQKSPEPWFNEKKGTLHCFSRKMDTTWSSNLGQANIHTNLKKIASSPTSRNVIDQLVSNASNHSHRHKLSSRSLFITTSGEEKKRRGSIHKSIRKIKELALSISFRLWNRTQNWRVH
jgi:hypothetical protein